LSSTRRFFSTTVCSFFSYGASSVWGHGGRGYRDASTLVDLSPRIN
jgi:hypothetical protein